jgi:hypothetical protein
MNHTAKALCVCSLLWLPAVGQQTPLQQMTNATVVQMVQAQISQDLIILAISQCEPHFQLDPANSQVMTQMGVTDAIFKAMSAKQNGQPIPDVQQPPPRAPSTGQQPSQQPPDASAKPRVFMQSSSHGNNWNARRDQSMELSKDFERDCPDVRITLNQANADYTVSLNHIEVGLIARDNQFQIADKNGDLLTRTKEGGSIKNGAKKACGQILADWAKKR